MWKSLALLLVCSAAALGQAPKLKTGAQSTSGQLKQMVPSTDQVEMWHRNGSLNRDVLNSFSPSHRATYAIIKNLTIYDMSLLRTPQDMCVVLSEVDKLNGTVANALIGLPASAASLPIGYINKIPFAVFALMRKSALTTVGTNFNSLQRAALCGRMLREHMDAETAELISDAIDCLPTFISLRLGNKLPRDIAYALIDGIKNRVPMPWTSLIWGQVLELAQGLDDKDINAVPNSVILANIPKFTDILPKLDPRLRMAIVSKCVSAMGGYSSISITRMRMIVPFLRYMRPSDLRKFPKALMARAASHLARLRYQDPNQRNEIADMLREQQGDPMKWNLTELKEGGAMLMSREYTMSQVNVSVLKDAMEDLCLDERTAAEAASVLERIMMDPSLSSPQNWSSAAILRKAKNCLSGLPIDFLKQINGSELVKVLKDIKDVVFSNAQRRALWEKVKMHLPKNLDNMNATEIGDLKAVLRGMKGDEMNRFNESHLADALGSLGDGVKLGRGQTQACMNKMNQLPGGLKGAVARLGTFANKLSQATFKNASDSVLGVSGDKQMMTDCKEDQCKLLFERIKNSIKNKTDCSLTTKIVRNFGKAIIGMSEDDVKKLPKGRVLMAVVDQVCKFAKRNDVPNVLLQALALKLKAVVNMTEPNVSQRVSHKDVLQSACLAKFFNEQELVSLGKRHCKTIVNELSSMPMDDIDPKQLKGLFRFARNCYNQTAPGMMMKTDFMEKVGNAMCGVEATHLNSFNKTVFFNFVAKLGCRCNFDENMRRAIADKFINEYNVSLSAPVNVTLVPKLGCLLGSLTPNELSQIPSPVLLDMCQDIAENADKLRDIIKSRAKNGQKADTSAADKSLYKKGIKRVMEACTQARQSLVRGGGVGRKRRQTTSLTCSQIMAMGSSVDTLTTSQIQNIADADFLNCADFLGNETDWSSAQKTELANVAQRSTTWNTPNTWSTANLQDAGTIAQGLTASQISTLTFGSLDGISELGDFEGWSSSQLTNGFAKWLADYKSSTASSVNQTELISLGHFACGASSTHISAIAPAEYGGAASSIGQLDTCSSTLADWAAHASSYFGAVSGWSASDVSTIGVVVGGLSTSDLGSFGQSHVQSISVTVIPNLPASTLAAMSETQLGYMSSAQASSVTATQQASMTSSQLLVLSSLGATLYTSSSVTLVPCLNLLVAALLAKLM